MNCPHDAATVCDACHDVLLVRLGECVELTRKLARCDHSDCLMAMLCRDCGARCEPGGRWVLPRLVELAKVLDTDIVVGGERLRPPQSDSDVEIVASRNPRS